MTFLCVQRGQGGGSRGPLDSLATVVGGGPAEGAGSGGGAAARRLLARRKRLDQRARGAQEAGVALGRTDELHPDGKPALTREQRQRQSRQPGQRPQGAEDGIAGGIEPFRSDAGRRGGDDGVVIVENV